MAAGFYCRDRRFTRLIGITGRKGCSRQLSVNAARPGRTDFDQRVFRDNFRVLDNPDGTQILTFPQRRFAG
jgi:hypothetical protein